MSGCTGPQSALDPAGSSAATIAEIFWVMLTGAAVIWVIVLGAIVFGARLQKRPISDRTGVRLILWAGAVFPTLVLTALLIYGLRLMPTLRPAEADFRIHIVGEQFWWRVTYHLPDRAPIISANEVRLPVGASVAFTLDTADVIHSFWIPALGGKLDLIPGRTNRLVLDAIKVGIYRGVCAEFCGESHSFMGFAVHVMEPDAFARWVEREASVVDDQASQVASETDQADVARGRDAFLANGCGGCHTVRGTPAAGEIGPDLTHVAGRSTLGAHVLTNTPENRALFIADVERVKPGARMPSYGALPPDELAAITAYLGSLK
ncbi:cytochrome c oxidase subunit II [Ancylobacter sp. SL191]|uniref:cytochrome c oxidase subunit II n=1 Tax=Ancylobacter sp. SL191 TaxID=2995166 RepID=UPI00226F0318|nr:cytochrome c oxidase subunit II [Ancylobacter sp. SL191]WAC27178.1 cytochrome c oxidase subunit II [Ancylobacter sp. SL191]